MFGGRKRNKVFVVGCNKTGTNSMRAILDSLGYRVGNQLEAELLLEDWARRDFSSLIRHCQTADAFQDVPFSMDYTYEIMDYVFPDSKFILTVRDDAEAWYESTTRFLTQVIGKDRLPTAEDLQEFPYRGHLKGWIWRAYELIFSIDESTLFDRKLFIRAYEDHNKRVCEYFRYRQDDLLVLNLSDPDSVGRLCAFLGVDSSGVAMPHLNRSDK
jgi:hypothetical protein